LQNGGPRRLQRRFDLRQIPNYLKVKITGKPAGAPLAMPVFSLMKVQAGMMAS
jgi:hypothetical protein